MADASLYERLGGVFAIAAVVDRFSDALIDNPIVGQGSSNPALREWHTNNLGRLPGLKFMRTLWVCQVTGGPLKFSPTKAGKTELGLEEAHRDLKISPEEFDEVAAEPGDAQPEDYDIALAAWKVERYTTLPVVAIAHRWAGLRTFTADRTPAVGFDGEAPAFFWLAGQGGFGLQTAPAIAEAVEALATGAAWPKALADLGVRVEHLAPARLR